MLAKLLRLGEAATLPSYSESRILNYNAIGLTRGEWMSDVKLRFDFVIKQTPPRLFRVLFFFFYLKSNVADSRYV